MTHTRSKRPAALFDLYGTLVDIETDEVTVELWEKLSQWCYSSLGWEISPMALKEEWNRLVSENVARHGDGFALDSAIMGLLGRGSNEADVAAFAAAFRRYSTKSLHLREYTRPLLKYLRAEGVRLGLVSNTEASLTNFDLDQLGIRALFDAIVLSSSAGVAKPDRGIVEQALLELGVEADSCVLVGDTLATDIAVANAAGLTRAILISDHQEDWNVANRYVVVPQKLDKIQGAIVDALALTSLPS